MRIGCVYKSWARREEERALTTTAASNDRSTLVCHWCFVCPKSLRIPPLLNPRHSFVLLSMPQASTFSAAAAQTHESSTSPPYLSLPPTNVEILPLRSTTHHTMSTSTSTANGTMEMEHSQSLHPSLEQVRLCALLTGEGVRAGLIIMPLSLFSSISGQGLPRRIAVH